MNWKIMVCPYLMPNVEARLRMERLNQKLISASLGGEEEVVTSSQELWVRGRRWSKTGGEHYITQGLVIHIVVLYWYWPTLPPRVPPARHSPREGWGVTSWPSHTSHSGHRDQNTRNDPIIKADTPPDSGTGKLNQTSNNGVTWI